MEVWTIAYGVGVYSYSVAYRCGYLRVSMRVTGYGPQTHRSDMGKSFTTRSQPVPVPGVYPPAIPERGTHGLPRPVLQPMGGIGSGINSWVFTQLEYLYTVCDGVGAIIPAPRTGTSSCFGPAYSLPLLLSPKLDSPLTSWITFSLMLWSAKL